MSDEYIDESKRIEDLFYDTLEAVLQELSEITASQNRFDTMKQLETSIDKDKVIEEAIFSSGEEELIAAFTEFKEKLARYYDNYWGINIDISNNSVSFYVLYSIYKTLYVNFIQTVSDYIIGAIKAKGINFKEEYDKLFGEDYTDFNEKFIDPYLSDADAFEYDDFFSYILDVDVGNAEVSAIQLLIHEAIAFDNQVFRKRIAREAYYEDNIMAIQNRIKKEFKIGGDDSGV